MSTTPGSLRVTQVQLGFTCSGGAATAMTVSFRADGTGLDDRVDLGVVASGNRPGRTDFDTLAVPAGTIRNYARTFPVTAPAGSRVSVNASSTLGDTVVDVVRSVDCSTPTPAPYDPPTITDVQADCDGVVSLTADNPTDLTQHLRETSGGLVQFDVAPRSSVRVTLRTDAGSNTPGPVVVATPDDTVEFEGSTDLGAGGEYHALTGRSPIASGCSRPDTLGSTVTLAGGDQLASENGAYRAVMQTDGNFVVYAGNRALWSTGTFGNPGATLTLQSDTNLVVYDAARSTALWFNRLTAEATTPAKLVMQDDGNLVEYRVSAGGAEALWSWKTGRLASNSPPPGDSVLVPGAALAPNNLLSKPRTAPGYPYDGNGYALIMQTDGNLVEYFGPGSDAVDDTPVWSSGTAGHPGAYLAMQNDGNAVIYQGYRPLWSTGTAGNPGAVLSLNSDGNIVVYASDLRTPLFATGSKLR